MLWLLIACAEPPTNAPADPSAPPAGQGGDDPGPQDGAPTTDPTLDNPHQHVDHVEMPDGAPAPEGAPAGPERGEGIPDGDPPPAEGVAPLDPAIDPADALEEPVEDDVEGLELDRGVPVFGGELDGGTVIHGTIEGSQLAQVRFITLSDEGDVQVVHLAAAVDGRFEVVAPSGATGVHIGAAELPGPGHLGPVQAFGALEDPVDVTGDRVDVAFALGDRPYWIQGVSPGMDRVLDPRELPPPPGAPPE